MATPTSRLVVTVDHAAVPVVHLDGSLDRGTTPLLREEAARLLLDRPGDVVVECSGLREVDAAGVRALADIRRHLPHPGTLLVVGAPHHLRRVLEASGLDRAVVVVPDGEEHPEGGNLREAPAVR